MQDRLKHLETLLSQVQSGKVSALVAVAEAGLIDVSEDSLSESASLARLEHEIEYSK